MKRFPIIICITSLIAACTDDFEQLPEQLNDLSETGVCSEVRSIEEALTIAGLATSEPTVSRSASVSKSAKKVHVVRNRISRASSLDTLLYAVDFDNEQGFAIIAAPKNVEPIMAIIDEGSFNDPVNSRNVQYTECLDKIESYVLAKSSAVKPLPVDTGKVPLLPMFYYDTISINRVAAPSLKVAWGQDYPENMYTPNGVTGCAPLAVAQFLSVFKIPNSMSYTFGNASVSFEELNWDSILRHKRSPNPDAIYALFAECDASEDAHQQLARIIREFGARLGSNYTYDESGMFPLPATKTDPYKIEPFIQSLVGKTPKSSGNSLSALFSSFQDTGGVAFVFSGYTENSKVGHVWLADGIRYFEYTIYLYELDPMNLWHYYMSSVVTSTVSKLIHYNWGYSGACNGWFNIKALDPNSAEEYDYDDLNNYSNEKYVTTQFQYLYYNVK